MARKAWYSPSTHSCMRLISRPLASRASRSSQPVAPNHLDDVPAGAQERRFQFLDDAAVAAHRTVQPLQVAVDHENQVVELLARGQRQRAQRFRLVGFAVAQERPHLAAGLRDDAAILQVPHEARLIDGADGSQPHRHRRGTARSPASARGADRTTTRDDRAARGGNSRGASRSGVLRETPGRKCPAKRGPGSRRNRPASLPAAGS